MWCKGKREDRRVALISVCLFNASPEAVWIVFPVLSSFV